LIPRLGIHKAIGAIAHRIAKVVWKVLHEQVRYIAGEHWRWTPQAMTRRMNKLTRQMRKLGYIVEVKPIVTTTVEAPVS
jgi:hypothetical protein